MIKPLIELTAFERDDFEFDPQATVKGLGIATTRRFMSHRVDSTTISEVCGQDLTAADLATTCFVSATRTSLSFTLAPRSAMQACSSLIRRGGCKRDAPCPRLAHTPSTRLRASAVCNPVKRANASRTQYRSRYINVCPSERPPLKMQPYSRFQLTFAMQDGEDLTEFIDNTVDAPYLFRTAPTSPFTLADAIRQGHRAPGLSSVIIVAMQGIGGQSSAWQSHRSLSRYSRSHPAEPAVGPATPGEGILPSTLLSRLLAIYPAKLAMLTTLCSARDSAARLCRECVADPLAGDAEKTKVHNASLRYLQESNSRPASTMGREVATDEEAASDEEAAMDEEEATDEEAGIDETDTREWLEMAWSGKSSGKAFDTALGLVNELNMTSEEKDAFSEMARSAQQTQYLKGLKKERSQATGTAKGKQGGKKGGKKGGDMGGDMDDAAYALNRSRLLAGERHDFKPQQALWVMNAESLKAGAAETASRDRHYLAMREATNQQAVQNHLLHSAVSSPGHLSCEVGDVDYPQGFRRWLSTL